MNENKFTPTAEEALRLAQEAAGEASAPVFPAAIPLRV